MNFYVMTKSYNCYGGHTTLSHIGDFLLRGASDFGDAVKEITVTLHFPHTGPPKKTLERLLDRHNSHRATLPKITYRRATGKIEIDIASDLIDSCDRRHSPQFSLPLFTGGVEEVLCALSLMRNRMKVSDVFDLDAFVAHCDTGRQRIPHSEEALQNLTAELKAAGSAECAAMTQWEKLDVDWEDFHPQAREILDDPFFWNCTDDFSPNGNDTGADLLEAYRDWLKTHRDGQPIQFFERLAIQWAYAGIEAMGDEVRDEAGVGLAFADIKLRGKCEEQARVLALKSLDKQRIQAETSSGWAHRDERLISLEKIKCKLQNLDNHRLG